MKGNAKHILKGYVLGILTVALLCSVTAFAVGRTSWSDVAVGGISIVVDGKKIHPTDASGNTVEPVIYKGTTYLPVRAVADALGKSVYWDGPNYTVYLGEMSGQLSYPTVELQDMKYTSGRAFGTSDLIDNYGNKYSTATYVSDSAEYILDMKYTHFKGTIFVPEDTHIKDAYFTFKADGKTIYTSAVMDSTSRPVDLDLNITGCNIFTIEYKFYSHSQNDLQLGDAGFYQ